jgi:hypothetical protein
LQIKLYDFFFFFYSRLYDYYDEVFVCLLFEVCSLFCWVD